MLIQPVITLNDDFVDTSLLSFVHTQFQVYGIIFDIYFDRIELEEKITVIHIQIGNCIFIFHSPLPQELLIIYISRFHSKQCTQVFRRIKGIPHPTDIPQIIFSAFIYLNEYIYSLIIIRGNTITYDNSVPITQFIIFINNQIKVFRKFFFYKFFGTEQINQFPFLIGFLHYTL